MASPPQHQIIINNERNPPFLNNDTLNAPNGSGHFTLEVQNTPTVTLGPPSRSLLLQQQPLSLHTNGVGGVYQQIVLNNQPVMVQNLTDQVQTSGLPLAHINGQTIVLSGDSSGMVQPTVRVGPPSNVLMVNLTLSNTIQSTTNANMLFPIRSISV